MKVKRPEVKTIKTMKIRMTSFSRQSKGLQVHSIHNFHWFSHSLAHNVIEILRLNRKSLEEHQANKDKGDELGEEMAKSNTDQQRLEALRQNQQDILAEHFKSKVSISDPSVGEWLIRVALKWYNDRWVIRWESENDADEKFPAD